MSLKRKAAHASIAQADTPDTKRRRGPDLAALAAIQESPQRTTQVGLEFIEKLKLSKDKSEHLIATHFHLLPDPNELPQYYQVIQMPIALETIEAKLRRYEYPNMSAVESDLKRMISNAKSFNEKNSEVHNDAEKIRKLVSNQFKEINPAYVNPSYTALPTPLPGEPGYVQSAGSQQVPATPTPAGTKQTPERPRRSLNLRGPKDPRARDSETPTGTPVAPTPVAPASVALVSGSAAGGNFAGKTFQQAQEDILQELCELTNEDGELIAGNFLQLPSRALKDYYAAIKHPESLNGLKKKAIGKQGHADPTGVSLMKSWAEFEHQVGYVWRNARHYNEDGSEIYELAGQLEKHFNKRVAEAKAVIPDPTRPKVKLNMSAKTPEPAAQNPKITLNVKPRPSSGGVSVDADALKRQQEMINSVTTIPGRSEGVAPEPQPATATVTSSQSPPLAAPLIANGLNNGVKAEIATPQLQAVMPQAPEMNGMPNGHAIGMPPPTIVARPHSGSPFPPAPTPQIYQTSNSYSSFEPRVRPTGKTAADALIQDLEVRTHPSLEQTIPAIEHIKWSFQPHDLVTQQSYTLYASQAHNFIRVQATIPPQPASRSTKFGVLFQGHQIKTVQQQWKNQLDEVDPRRPMYDIPLQEGQINRIEVYMRSDPARGAPKIAGEKPDVEYEKYTLYIHRYKA